MKVYFITEREREELECAAYKRGWNDREDDLIAGVERVTGQPQRPAPQEWVREAVERIRDAISRATDRTVVVNLNDLQAIYSALPASPQDTGGAS